MVMRFLDLVFWKLYSVYRKKDSVPFFSTLLFMGLIRLNIIFFFGLFAQFFFDIYIEFKSTEQTVIAIACFELPILLYTFYRYSKKGKIKELERKYSDKKFDKIKPWFFFMTPVFFFGLTIVMIFIFA